MKKKANGCSLDASNHLPSSSLLFLLLPFIPTHIPFLTYLLFLSILWQIYIEYIHVLDIKIT